MNNLFQTPTLPSPTPPPPKKKKSMKIKGKKKKRLLFSNFDFCSYFDKMISFYVLSLNNPNYFSLSIESYMQTVTARYIVRFVDPLPLQILF